MESEDTPASIHIFDLPEKIRVKILKHLNHEERLLCQFVCRRFRNDLRLRVGIRTKITEDSTTGIIKLRDLKISSVLVGRYERPLMTPQRLIFRPECIKELIFESKICLQFFDSFLSRCKYIKILTMKYAQIDERMPAGINSLNLYEFRNGDLIKRAPPLLSHLKVCKIVLQDRGSKRQRSSDSLRLLLRLLNAPSLKLLSITVNGVIKPEEAKDIHSSVLRYLVRNTQLAKLALSTTTRSLRNASPDDRPEFLIDNQEVSQEVISTLGKRLFLREVILSESGIKMQTWQSILALQKFISVLQILHPVPWQSLRKIIQMNFFTLRFVAINAALRDCSILCGKEWQAGKEIDLKCFSRLNTLEELYISIASTINNGLPDIVNFRKLPESLKVIGFKNAIFEVDELFQLISSPKFKIESLGLIFPDTPTASNGCSLKTLEDLLTVQSLDELLVVGFMRKGPNKILQSFKRLNRSTIENSLHIYQERENRGIPRWKAFEGCYLFGIESNWAGVT